MKKEAGDLPINHDGSEASAGESLIECISVISVCLMKRPTLLSLRDGNSLTSDLEGKHITLNASFFSSLIEYPQ